MISNTVFPTFYVIDFANKAASTNFFFSDLCADTIEKICIGSYGFSNDIEAMRGATEAINFMLDNAGIADRNLEWSFNPDFFPTFDVKSDDQKLDDIVEIDGLSYIQIKTFDEIGNYIVAKGSLVGDDYEVTVRIGVNPTQYKEEKQKEVTALMNKGFDPHREIPNKPGLH